MSPFEFLERYHNLRVVDTALGLNFTANIHMYVSGKVASVLKTEYAGVISALKKKQGLVGDLPDIFYVKGAPEFSHNEPFYKRGIARAYFGRASPDEMRDAIRIAWYATRCEPWKDPKRYTEGFFGQDCNSFVGNYLGISPNTGIRAYGRDFKLSEEELENFTGLKDTPKDVYLGMPHLPLEPVTKLHQIQQGTVIVTYRTNGSRPFKHIALVQSFTPMDGTTSPKAIVQIAEWGVGSSDIGAHQDNVPVTLKLDATCEGMGSRKLIGWKPNKDELRFFLDASPLISTFSIRGWDICNREGF